MTSDRVELPLRVSTLPLSVLLAAVLGALALAAPRAASAAGAPVLGGEYPDPTVVRHGDGYVAAATSDRWAPVFPLLVSDDLVSWRQAGSVYERAPRWALGACARRPGRPGRRAHPRRAGLPGKRPDRALHRSARRGRHARGGAGGRAGNRPRRALRRYSPYERPITSSMISSVPAPMPSDGQDGLGRMAAGMGARRRARAVGSEPVPSDLTALVPREVIFGNPERVQPRISPDGTRLAYIAPRDGVLNVWVGEVGAPEDGFRPVTDDTDRGIRVYFWSHDNRRILYPQDKDGDENWRFYDVDLDSGATRDLTPFDGVQAQFIAYEKRFPTEMLLGLNRDDPELHDVYHLDLVTGELEKVVENFGVTGWAADPELRVRAALRHRPDGGMDVVARRPDGPDEWATVLAVGAEDALGTHLQGFTGDGRGLYLVSSVDADASRLLRLDLDLGGTEILAEDPRYDVGAVVLHPDSREVQLVNVIKARDETCVLDPSIQADIDGIRSIQKGDFGITDRDHADRQWLVTFSVDDGPDSYYLWDRQTRAATFLFHHLPALSDYRLAPMEPFAFSARDGLEIHGYVTFPVGTERERLATVLCVHGGPWGRDVWGYSAGVQWLANRGYLCVQVNFRGSTGYGKEFLNAGDREWAGKMHDDLIDAVEFVVDAGWADPERVAILGGSYGGYAALVGATFTPDVFRCAISFAGVSNLLTMLENIPRYWVPIAAQLHQRVGDPETEAEFLWSRSPLSRVDDIRIPVFLAQGANDPRVTQAESEQIVAAMREKGIEHEYMLLPDEGHGLAKPENRMRVFAAVERLLAKHLDGRYEP